MSTQTIILFIISGANAILVITLGIHYMISRHARDNPERIARQVNELQLSFADFVDKYTHQVRRDRVRRLRESQEEEPSTPIPTDRKAALRAAARAKRNGK